VGDVTAIVVPTRNRADLARNAVESLRRQDDVSGLKVLVSDNSTDPAQVDDLRSWVEGLDDPRVAYVRPDEGLSMTAHWEWAVDQALALPEVERVGILTDRMVFRTGMLAPVVDAARAAPETLVSYTLDRVNDWASPPVLEQYEWSGRVLEIDSAHLLRLAAERAVLPGCLPRMLNTVVPRGVLDAVRARFGSIFESVSPDFAFAFRSLVVLDSIRFLDASCVVGYAIDRSNGASIERGVASSDAADFNANLDRRGMNFATPVPELRTVRNAVYNEYCFVQAEAQSAKAPPLRRSAYLAAIAMDLALIEDPELKRETSAMIERGGWRWRGARGRWWADNALRLAGWFGRRPGALARRAALVAGDTGPGRQAIEALDRVGVPAPPAKARPQFSSTEEALAYADSHSPPREQGLDHLFYMLDPPGRVRDMGQAV
jgi:hypothetical protein